ncbi:MAG: ABC transporter ATP-binding protein [Deltaproteobacteria bacterium]|nr:ABC transporter ATP-binding protein [Deltaproteobacteria bacterium]
MQISISQLSKRYPGGKLALKDIDMDIPKGLFGLLGPNGAGKTTLMRILVTLLKPSSGRVKVNDLDIRKNRKEIRRQIGYLPQDFSVFAKLTVWEFMDYSACLNGILSKNKRRDRIDLLLETVGLFEARDRMTGKLSGGMKRRLGIAQTLIGDPPLLVVDEPTVGLDPEERIRFRNLLSDLSSQDRIILLSTHIVGDISSTCETIALMDMGRIIFHGPPADLVDSARGKVWTISTGYEDLDSWKARFPVISTVPSEGGYELRIVAENPGTMEAIPVEPNLEDAYIHYMQTASSGHLSGIFEKKE